MITQHAVRSLLAPGGTLAFVITGTVFANESSEHFRRFEGAKVMLVEDYAAVKPFAEATHPTLVVLRRASRRRIPCRIACTAATASRELLAAPPSRRWSAISARDTSSARPLRTREQGSRG